jgi:hypothetical protein
VTGRTLSLLAIVGLTIASLFVMNWRLAQFLAFVRTHRWLPEHDRLGRPRPKLWLIHPAHYEPSPFLEPVRSRSGKARRGRKERPDGGV